MSIKLLPQTLSIALLLPVVFCVTACDGQPDNGPEPVVMTEQMFQDQIDKIRNDPNMSEQAKQMAINGIETAKRMRETNGGTEGAQMESAAKAREEAKK